ncbi:TetR/AcrR family transcriptional regulator [uncultured Methylobacterium sp.]|uniref:TetR/AcrR family transcriptional regulator n=1 Tax=uncultured Methylobacterium sp. TaxID=157278 RepID=UPI0035CA1A32
MSTSDRAVPYHHGDLRRALLDAATRLLVGDGVDAVTLREVARAAGVSHNAPYRHFPSREALLAGLATDGFVRLRRRLDAVAETETGRVNALGRAYLTFAVEERPHFLLMFGGTVGKTAFPDLEDAAAAAFAILEGAVDAEGGGMPGAALRAWALVHGLAHLVAERQIAPETAFAALGEPA